MKTKKQHKYTRVCPYFGTRTEVTLIWTWNGSVNRPEWELETIERKL